MFPNFSEGFQDRTLAFWEKVLAVSSKTPAKPLSCVVLVIGVMGKIVRGGGWSETEE